MTTAIEIAAPVVCVLPLLLLLLVELYAVRPATDTEEEQ